MKGRSGTRRYGMKAAAVHQDGRRRYATASPSGTTHPTLAHHVKKTARHSWKKAKV
jgi:hypothetical protein